MFAKVGIKSCRGATFMSIPTSLFKLKSWLFSIIFIIDPAILVTLINHMKTQSKQKRFDDLEGIWQILYPEHFINELLIHHPKQRGEKEIEEVASFMRSDYEYITWFASTHKTHTPPCNSIRSVNISDIFESIKHEDGSLIEPKLILIDGAPGMGKTTLCKEIAYQWANGKLLKNTKIIFLLFLRDPALQRMHDLKDFIHYFYNFEPTYLDLSKQCADILTKRDNSDVTILMDGYDEFQDKQNNLLVQNIIKRYVLSQCRIVITSRPIASENLHKFANVRVEILGFTEQSKIEYIKKELKDDPIKVKNLLSYLNNHSDINKVCYIPIMMTIMVCTFKEYEELPTNQSELYERFVTLVISRCLQKLGNTGIAYLNLLPEKYYSYLEKLSEFAYKTIEIDKIIFNDKDIEKVIPNFALPSKELQGLGLFRAIEHSSIKAMGTCVWYNFLHLSLHEFLAAYHLKLLDPSEQFKILKKTFFIKRYVNVWAMFIGLQQDVAHDFHQFLIYSHIYGASDTAKDQMKFTLENSNLLHFSEIEIKYIDVKNIMSTFQLLCCKNNVDNLHAGMTQENYIRTYDSWYLLHCTSNWTKVFVSLCSVENSTSDQLIEVYLLDKNTQDTLYHQVVAELEQNLSLSVMLVSDNTLVGYRINCNQLTDALIMNQSIKSVILRDCLISDDNNMTGLIAGELTNVIKNNSNLEHLDLRSNDLGPTATNLILQALKGNHKLKILNLNDNNMTGKVSEELANVIENNCNLEALALHGNALGPSASVILQALKVSTKLRGLNLNDNSMTGQVAEDLANIIKNNSNLEILCLRNNELGLSAIKILQALKDNSKLIILDLNSNNMTKQVAADLANVISNNSGLERIHLFNNDLRSSATVILQALQQNSNLQFLDLGDNIMTEQVIEELGNVIKNNHNLKSLGLGNNKFGPSAKMILQALMKTCTIITLFLHNNNMTGQAAEGLANVIKNNSNLEQLDLESNNIGPSAIVILQALMENSKLKLLNLNSNYMTERVVDDLANVIKNNSNLEQLGLENNKLGPSATVILQALKENSQLKVLNLNNNNMTGQIAEDLANVINNNSCLEELYLSNNNLKLSAIVILQALTKHSKLKMVNLSSNYMTGHVVEDLVNVIKNNSNLRQIALENNILGPSAAVILQALKEKYQLKLLNLNSNNMTGQVAEDLANVIQNNSGLEELYVSNNNLGPSACMILQALKQKSKVKVLYLHNTYMTGKIVEELANVIKCNSDLEQLGLDNNKLGPSATVILQALKENSQLKVLNLNNNNMTGQVAEDLANVIKNHCNLEKLFLANNNLGPSAIVILQALIKNSKLKLLNLTNNNMTGEIAVDLVNVIKNNTGLEELSLSNNNLNSSAIVILQTLKQNHQLSTLNMSNSFLTECTAAELVSVIKNNPFITKLWLGDNMLQSGVMDIAVSCKSLTHLLALELSCNMINPVAVVHLASIVTKINSLHTLIFGSLVVNVKERICLDVYQFSDPSKQNFLVQNNDTEMLEFFCIGVWRLWFVDKVKFNYNIRNYFPTLFSYNYKKISFVDIKPNLSSIVEQSKQKLFSLDATNMIISLFDIIESLTVLDLEYSNINKEAAIKLATALNCNNVLEQLWLRGNVLGADGGAVILTSLQNISTLRVLDLSYNNISSTSANGIAAVINSNQFLEQLWLDGNTLMTTGVITIASVLKKHCNLRLLSLSNNGITEDATGEISAIVNSNTLLGGLLLSNNQLKFIGTCKIAAIQLLHILELTNNCIDVTAAEELALMLFSCPYLRELYLGNNNLETAGAVKVCQALKNIQILQVLSLNNNNITTEAASEICNVISTNTNLDILLLGGNDLQTTGALQIADTVKNNNPTMQLLSLSDNNVNEQVKEDIKVMLCDLKLFV